MSTEVPEQASSTWYRGEHCNFFPDKKRLKELDIEENFLRGWIAEAPPFKKGQAITAFGSCFARNISSYLYNKGHKVHSPVKKRGGRKKSYVIAMGDGMNTTFSIRQQFEWAFEEKEFSDLLWFDKDGHYSSTDQEIKNETKEIFLTTDVFIFTLGLAEVWYNKQTQDVFWRGVPQKHFDPAIHGFKVSSVAENKDNLHAIYKIIKKNCPNASIIVTLSPVPLNATFRKETCLTANSCSKAILRSAIDEFYREAKAFEGHRTNSLFYWPSYELVREYFINAYEADNRHIKSFAINQIMQLFEHYYFQEANVELNLSRKEPLTDLIKRKRLDIKYNYFH